MPAGAQPTRALPARDLLAGDLLAWALITWAVPGCAPPAADPPADPAADPAADPPWISIPAGEVTLGRDGAAHADQGPPRRVRVSAFELQATLVTVAAYARHAPALAPTDAERLGHGLNAWVGLDDWQWERVPGATWAQPFGPDRPAAQGPDHPVVMLSWADADRYCRARGWRLPTEAEWQRAMSAGAEGQRYPWGDDPRPGGRPRFNHWEGADHHENRAEDGHVHTSPVRAYPPNAWGLYDPVGNVWQFVADWWAADAYARLEPGALDPQGPPDGWAKVGRGGSWWCSEGTCEGYGLWARGKARPDAPFGNNGFRCARGQGG